MTTEKNQMLIIQKSGFMGSRKPCTSCGKCGKNDEQHNNRDEGDLEPLLPVAVREILKRKVEGEEDQEEEENQDQLEPMLPASVREHEN